jgi:hypothetical protein
MALILRPGDKKVLSISRRKIHCHETIYARFDPATGAKPKILIEDFVLSKNDVDTAIVQAQNINNVDTMHKLPHVDPMHAKIPDHVLSIKC